MATKRYINTRFWSDTYVDDLDPTEKLMFLYFLTNERTTLAGVYELPLKIMAVETGIDKSMIEKILRRFEDDGKIWYIEGWVWIKNHIKHQNYENPNIQKGIARIMAELPPKVLKQIAVIDSLWIGYADPMYAQPHLDSNLDLDLNSNSDSNKGSTSEPSEKVSYKPVKEKKPGCPQTKWKNKKRAERGKQPKFSDNSLLRNIHYFKDQAMSIHGQDYPTLSAPSGKMMKGFKNVSKFADLKKIIDWWLEGGGEYADYTPDAFIAESTVNKFKAQKGSNKKSNIIKV